MGQEVGRACANGCRGLTLGEQQILSAMSPPFSGARLGIVHVISS